MNITKIKETCLYFPNLNVAREFYHDKLGFAIISELEGKHIFFRVGSSVLLCFNPSDSRTKKSPPPHYGSGPVHFAFEVRPEDYQAHKREIELLGITILDHVKWREGLESFYFEDPEGHLCEIVPQGVWD